MDERKEGKKSAAGRTKWHIWKALAQGKTDQLQGPSEKIALAEAFDVWRNKRKHKLLELKPLSRT